MEQNQDFLKKKQSVQQGVPVEDYKNIPGFQIISYTVLMKEAMFKFYFKLIVFLVLDLVLIVVVLIIF